MKISACVITKNEEENLPSCLESIKSVVSEIIIVDTGSEDRTIEVAKSFGAKVYNFTWVNDFSKVRNYAISKAKGDWIIFLDADEHFTEESMPKLKSTIKKADKFKKDAVGCLLSNFDDAGKLINSVLTLRIFKKDEKLIYTGAIHEKMINKKGDIKLFNALDDIKIFHNGYSEKEIKRKAKGKRNRDLLLKDLELNPSNSDTLFYISESFMIENDYNSAFAYAQKAKKHNNWNSYGLKQKNYLNMINVYYRNEASNSMIGDLLNDALKEFPTYPDFNICKAELLLRYNRYEDAIELLNTAKENMNEVLTSQSKSYLNLHVMLGILGDCYYKIGDFEMCVKSFVEALKFNKYHMPVTRGLINILLNHDEIDSVIKFLEKIYDLKENNDIVHLFKASLYGENKKLARFYYSKINQKVKEELAFEHIHLLLLEGCYEDAVTGLEKLNEWKKSNGYLEKRFVSSLLAGKEFLEKETSNTIPPLVRFGKLLLKDKTVIEKEDEKYILNAIKELVDISREDLVLEIIEAMESKEITFYFAEALYAKEKYDEALKVYDQFLKDYTEVDDKKIGMILFKMADCLFHLNQLEMALMFLKDAQNLNPEIYQIYALGIRVSEQLSSFDTLNNFVELGITQYPDSNFVSKYQNMIKNGRSAKKRVLIGSPIHQKPKILDNFLQSLMKLSQEVFDIDFLFMDDNTVKESKDLLIEFQNKMNISNNKVFIYNSESIDEYICDSNTHYWNESLIWKVAEFKNIIINYAKENSYDYLFLVDSDLILHPKTIEQLAGSNKEIISNIFWTKWQPDSIELPQVWLSDQYTLHERGRNENLTNEEITSREISFLEKLRKPGVYEVGGLGACTLISRKALLAGVNFNEIKNVTFWGEDRHFCIRAAALGFKLYVDTHLPAYHIYRESDIPIESDYMEISEKKVTENMRKFVKNGLEALGTFHYKNGYKTKWSSYFTEEMKVHLLNIIESNLEGNITSKLNVKATVTKCTIEKKENEYIALFEMVNDGVINNEHFCEITSGSVQILEDESNNWMIDQLVLEAGK